MGARIGVRVRVWLGAGEVDGEGAPRTGDLGKPHALPLRPHAVRE